MAEPKHNKGASKQDYGTPPELLAAVKEQIGIENFAMDLAASAENTVANAFLTEADNSLNYDWSCIEGWSWCNPPYSHITPWVKKASESTNKIAMLLPASVGSNWWRDYVHLRAEVWFLNGRVKFVGAPTHSPKDHVILLYNAGEPGHYEVWTWNT